MSASIFDLPPANVLNELDNLRGGLDQAIPAKIDNQNLLIATWNIRSFSSLTREWLPDSDHSPKRELRSLRYIIEILSRFDVIAIQEVKGDLRALRDTAKFLGENWSFLLTDVTRGSTGNSERLGFLFDTTRVKLSGLAGELVIPEEAIARVP